MSCLACWGLTLSGRQHATHDHFIDLIRGDVCSFKCTGYRVAAELCGPLGNHAYVVDFIKLRDALQSITAEMDHRMLLPGEHPSIQVVEQDREVVTTFGERRWVFPSEDCLILPVVNTTAEMLARYIGRRLIDSLSLQAPAIQSVRVDVDECDGQLASWETDLAADVKS